jgi:hypothetical protein
VLRAMLGGDLTRPPRSYALRRRSEARTRSRNGIRRSGGGAGGFTAFFPALRADCRDCSASWPVERHALARPSSSDARKAVAAFQPRRPALALAEYPTRIAKTRPESWAGDLPPKRRRPEPAGQTMGGCYRCKFAAWTAAVR